MNTVPTDDRLSIIARRLALSFMLEEHERGYPTHFRYIGPELEGMHTDGLVDRKPGEDDFWVLTAAGLEVAKARREAVRRGGET